VPGPGDQRVERWAPAVTGVVLAVPFLVFRYPPMGDLAFHEAGVALLRHFGDPRYLPPGLYTLNLGEPNQLFHMLAYPLSFVLSTDWACKCVVAAAVLAIVTGAAHLATYLGVTRWSALLVAPLALGWMTRWGLVANLLGFGLWLWSLPALDRAARRPTLRRSFVAVAAMLLLYLAHESSMVLAALASLLLVAWARVSPRKPGAFIFALTPAGTAGALAVLYHLRSATLKAPSILETQATPFSFWQRVVDAPGALFSVGDTSVFILVGSLAGLAALGAFARPASRDVPWRFVAVGAVAAIAYLFFPGTFYGSTLVHARFLAPAFAILALVALPQRGDSPPRLAPLVVLLPVGMLAATMHLFTAADRLYRDLDVILANIDDDAAVAQLDLTPRNPSSTAPVVGAGARVLAVHGGRLLFSFTDAPTYPVTIPATRRWDEPVKRLAMTPFAFAPAYDLTRFRYVVAWVPSARIRGVLDEAFAPEARRVVAVGSWMLFESTLPQVSIVADDGVLPTPAPVPLATRVKEVLARAQER
jgi:hypothetical protein